MLSEAAPPSRSTIRLPNSCPHNHRQHHTFCSLLREVRTDAWNQAGFSGKLYQAGARVEPEALGVQPVVLEYAGPQGTWSARGKQRRRESLWLLWRYDWPMGEWCEIARACALDWSWALVLREPAIRALRPAVVERPAVDTFARGKEVSDEIWRHIDSALGPELPAVRVLVMCSLYDSMAGRLVEAGG